MNLLNKLTSLPAGAILVLACAAFLEAFGDSLFQTGFYRTSGWGRVGAIVAGALVLSAYGAFVNLPRWDFGRLLGVYVVLFFVVAQVLNKLRFGQSPTRPIYLGGLLILAGGAVIAFFKA